MERTFGSLERILGFGEGSHGDDATESNHAPAILATRGAPRWERGDGERASKGAQRGRRACDNKLTELETLMRGRGF